MVEAACELWGAKRVGLLACSSVNRKAAIALSLAASAAVWAVIVTAYIDATHQVQSPSNPNEFDELMKKRRATGQQVTNPELLGILEAPSAPAGWRPPAYKSLPIDKGGLTFMGYDCTEDCSGHEAGYQWAEDEGVEDADDCKGNSQSFIEGCEAYIEEME